MVFDIEWMITGLLWCINCESSIFRCKKLGISSDRPTLTADWILSFDLINKSSECVRFRKQLLEMFELFE